MALSNAEKQARFRKKEQLKKLVSQCLGDIHLLASTKLEPRGPLGLLDPRATYGNLDSQLRQAARLPSGWTDEDLQRAEDRVRGIHEDALRAVDSIGTDVEDGRNSLAPSQKSSNSKNWLAEHDEAKRDTIALAGHLVAAMDLSKLPKEQCAAALMEALRQTGRSLANSSVVGQSDATAVCLASLNRHRERPEWFLPRMAAWLHRNLDDDARRVLGAKLLEDDGGPSR